MGIQLKRTRDGNGTLAALDLTAADAADRRLDIVIGSAVSTDAPGSGTRLIGFDWTMTTAEARDITISRIDRDDSNREYVLEQRLGDTGTSGTWRPPSEEATGVETGHPSKDATSYRIQFSQAGGACNARVLGLFKAV